VPIGNQKRDAETARLVDRMTQHAGRCRGQLTDVRGSEEIVAVEHEQLVRLDVRPTAAQGVARPARVALRHDRPVAKARLCFQIVLDLFGQIVNHDNQPVHLGRQRRGDPIQDRTILHLEQRLGRMQRMRTKARPQTSGKQNGIHTVPRSPLAA